MTPRRLRIAPAAQRDLDRRARLLVSERGADFAARWVVDIYGWLERIAESGAQLGTAVGSDPARRTFGYKRQATVLAQFTSHELGVLRIYFCGQDWTGRH